MKHTKQIFLAALMGASLVASPARATDVGVSISIGQPGFYGRIDIGGYPAPVLLYPQPVIIRPAIGVVYEPVYVHVPPGQAKRWGDYCGRYGACGRPVYFVEDRWYSNVYVPRYREQHGHAQMGWEESPHRHEGGHGEGHGHGRHGKAM